MYNTLAGEINSQSSVVQICIVHGDCCLDNL